MQVMEVSDFHDVRYNNDVGFCCHATLTHRHPLTHQNHLSTDQSADEIAVALRTFGVT